MRKVEITNAKNKNGELFISDFSKYTLKNVNLLVGKTLVGAGYSYKDYGNLPSPPVKLYSVNGKTLCYCFDKKLYALEGGLAKQFTSVRFDAPPEVFETIYRGELAVCALHNGYGVIVGVSVAFLNFPEGKGYLTHNGVLCCYKGDKVIFGGAYDYAGYTVSVTESGFIGGQNIGKITALKSDGEKIIVFGEIGVCYIYIDGDRTSYRAKYPNFSLVNPVSDSVVSFANNHYFIMQDGLYKLGKELKKLPSVLDGNNYELIGSAFSFDGKYAVPVNIDGEYLFVYDTLTDQSYLTACTGKLFGDGGIYADKLNLSYGKLDKTTLPYCVWQSRFIDLGSDLEKTVYKITLKTSSAITLIIKGDYGARKIFCEGGYKTVTLSLRSKQFAFTVYGGNNGFKLEDLKIYYRS